MQLIKQAEAARSAAKILRTASTEQKNHALLAIADSLEQNKQAILQANMLDMEACDLSESLKDRLLLNEARLKQIASDP